MLTSIGNNQQSVLSMEETKYAMHHRPGLGTTIIYTRSIQLSNFAGLEALRTCEQTRAGGTRILNGENDFVVDISDEKFVPNSEQVCIHRLNSFHESTTVLGVMVPIFQRCLKSPE
jgi:hypothetical protein